MSTVTKEELKAAIAKMEVNETNFTKSNKPDAKVLTDTLNKNVSAKFRDEVWAEMQAEVVPEGATPIVIPPVPDKVEAAKPTVETKPQPTPAAPPVPVLDGGNDGLYLNATNRNVFTESGRVAPGQSIDLGDEDPTVYKGRLVRQD